MSLYSHVLATARRVKKRLTRLVLAHRIQARHPTLNCDPTAIWDYGERTFATWYSRNATGETIGLRIAVDAPAARVRWNQTIIVFTMGGLL